MLRNQKGYTLIESLLVLSIFIVISSITAFTIKPQYNMANDEAFISQLKADLLYAQQYAISHQAEVTVHFMADKHKYIFIDGITQIHERNYSTGISITQGSMQLSFKYVPSGNVNKFGTLFIQFNDKKYRLTVLIGKGRFYVTEV